MNIEKVSNSNLSNLYLFLLNDYPDKQDIPYEINLNSMVSLVTKEQTNFHFLAVNEKNKDIMAYGIISGQDLTIYKNKKYTNPKIHILMYFYAQYYPYEE